MLDRRLHMVNSQLRTGGVVDKAVLAAFLDVPRQRFVAPEHESLAYLDRELPARGAKVRRLLAPMVLARMLQAATVVPSDRALDVAGGSGYGAAILAAMGAKVVLLESDAGAAEKAKAELHSHVNVNRGHWARSTAAPQLLGLSISSLSRARSGSFRTVSSRCWPILDVLSAIDASSEPSQAVIYENNGGAISRRALFETEATFSTASSRGELRLLNVEQSFTKRRRLRVKCLMFATLGGKVTWLRST